MDVIHILLYAGYMVLFIWLIYRWSWFKTGYATPFQLTLFFVLKVVAGIALTLVYTYYYTDPSKADIYRYFSDSVIISNVVFKDPVAWLKIISGIGINQSDVFKYILPTQYFSHPHVDFSTNNTLIIRVSSLFNYLSYYNIFINTLLLNFACFIGLTALLKAVGPYIKGQVKWIYIPLFLLPSVVFWGSGLLKEQLLFVFIGPYIFIHNRTILKNEAFSWLLMPVLLWGMYMIKPSVAVCLLLATVFLPGFKVTQTRQATGILFAFVLLFILGISLDWHHKLAALLINKRNEFIMLAISENAGSNMDVTIYKPELLSIIKLLPHALINAILRPFVWEGGKAFQLLFAIENLVFIGLLIYLWVRYYKWPAGEGRLLFLFCITFALLNYLLIGLTVPVMGAIVHYRIIAAPFLLLALLVAKRAEIKTQAQT